MGDALLLLLRLEWGTARADPRLEAIHRAGPCVQVAEISSAASLFWQLGTRTPRTHRFHYQVRALFGVLHRILNICPAPPVGGTCGLSNFAERAAATSRRSGRCLYKRCSSFVRHRSFYPSLCLLLSRASRFQASMNYYQVSILTFLHYSARSHDRLDAAFYGQAQHASPHSHSGRQPWPTMRSSTVSSPTMCDVTTR